MSIDYSCLEPHTVYTNGGSATKDITLTISDHCGGKTKIYVVKPNGDHLFDKELSSPGQVALSVPKDHEVHVFCNGGNDQQHECNVSVNE